MALLDEVGTYLEMQGIGTLGTDLFRSRLPDTPDNAVGLIETGGLTPTFVMESPRVEVDQPTMQVLIRNQDYPTARALMNDVIVALVELTNTTLSGVVYQRSTPIQSPFTLGPDEQNRILLACNFQFMKEFS